MNKVYSPEIDGLRAIAVMLVFLFHLKIPGFQGGFIGVDIFFVISGYLITSIYFYEVEKNNSFNFYNYFTKRLFRLLPALYFVVLLSLIASLLIFSPIDLKRIAETGLYSIFFLSNIFFFLENSYWSNLNEFKVFLHTWSLGIEMSFYLIMPVYLLLIFKLKNNFRIPAIVLTIIFSLILILYLVSKGPMIESQVLNSSFYGRNVADIQFYLFPFRFFEFLFGTLVFFIPKSHLSNRYKVVFFSIGIFLITLTLFVIKPNHEYQNIIVSLSLIGSALIIYFKDAPKINRIINNKVSVYLGLISYSLYLVHWPVITFTKYSIINEPTLFIKLLIFIISIIISFLIYKFIEKPFRNKNFKSRAIVVPLTMFLLLLFSSHVINSNGLINRLNVEQKEILSKIKSIGDPCNRIYSTLYKLNYKICLAGNEKKAEMILLGDSNATSWFPASKKIAKKLNFSLVNYRRICNSFPKNPILDCFEINSSAEILIIGNLWFFWQSEYENIETDILRYINHINDIRYNKNFKKIKKIIIFGQIPALKMQKLSIMSCLLRPEYLFDNKNCEKTYTYLNDTDNTLKKYRKVNYYLEKYGSEIISKNFEFIFVDPLKSLCKNDDCIQYKNSELFYANNNHLSEAGTNFVYEDNKERLFKFLE